MTYDDEGSLFDEEYEFVDEDEEEVEEKAVDADDGADEEAPAPKSKRKPSRKGASRDAKAEGDENEETAETAETEEAKPAEAAEPPGPPTDHVVHLYEYRQFKRTVPREFTNDDAVAFAVEFNRTSAAHSRHAVAANRDDEPSTTI